MSVSNLNEFPLHEISTIKFSLLIVGLIKFLFLQILLLRKQISLFSRSSPAPDSLDRDDSRKKMKIVGGDDDERVCGGEAEMVMRRLGIFGEGEIPAKLEVGEIFEEREPSLDEVREAFDVFDEKRDGFIDERELQRVLCALGLKEGLEVENCRRMIAAVDEDGDGRIGFHEFVKFLENTFA